MFRTNTQSSSPSVVVTKSHRPANSDEAVAALLGQLNSWQEATSHRAPTIVYTRGTTLSSSSSARRRQPMTTQALSPASLDAGRVTRNPTGDSSSSRSEGASHQNPLGGATSSGRSASPQPALTMVSPSMSMSDTSRWVHSSAPAHNSANSRAHSPLRHNHTASSPSLSRIHPTPSSTHISGYTAVFTAALGEEPPIAGPDAEATLRNQLVASSSTVGGFRRMNTNASSTAPSHSPHRGGGGGITAVMDGAAHQQNNNHTNKGLLLPRTSSFVHVESNFNSPRGGSPARRSSVSRAIKINNHSTPVALSVGSISSGGGRGLHNQLSEPGSPEALSRISSQLFMKGPIFSSSHPVQSSPTTVNQKSTNSTSDLHIPLDVADMEAQRRRDKLRAMMPPDPRRLTTHLSGATREAVSEKDSPSDQNAEVSPISARSGSSGANSGTSSHSKIVPHRPILGKERNSQTSPRQHPAIDRAAKGGGTLPVRELSVYYKEDVERKVAALVALYRNPSTSTDEVGHYVLACVRQCQHYAEHLLANSYFAEAFGLLEEAERLLNEERGFLCEMDMDQQQQHPSSHQIHHRPQNIAKFHRNVLDSESDAVSALRRRTLHLLNSLEIKRARQEEHERLGALSAIAMEKGTSALIGTAATSPKNNNRDVNHTPPPNGGGRRRSSARRTSIRGVSGGQQRRKSRRQSVNSPKNAQQRHISPAPRPDSISPEALHDYVHAVPPPVRPFEHAASPKHPDEKPPHVSRSGATSGKATSIAGGALVKAESDTVGNTLSGLSPRAFYFKRFDPDLAQESVVEQEAYLHQQREVEQQRAAAGVGRKLSIPSHAQQPHRQQPPPSSPLTLAHSPHNSSNSMSFRGVPLAQFDDMNDSTSLLFGGGGSTSSKRLRRQQDNSGEDGQDPYSSPSTRRHHTTGAVTTSDQPHRAHLAVPVRDIADVDTTHMLHTLEDHDQYEYHCLAQNEGLTGDFEDALAGGLIVTVTSTRKRDNGGSRVATERVLASANLPELLRRQHRSPQTARVLTGSQQRPGSSSLLRPRSAQASAPLSMPSSGGVEVSTPRRNILVKRVELRPKRPEVLEAMQQLEREASSAILSQAHAKGTLSTYGTSPYLWSPHRPLGVVAPTTSTSPIPTINPRRSQDAPLIDVGALQGMPSDLFIRSGKCDEISVSIPLLPDDEGDGTDSTPPAREDVSTFLRRLQRKATLLSNDGEVESMQAALNSLEGRRRAAYDDIVNKSAAASSIASPQRHSRTSTTSVGDLVTSRRVSGSHQSRSISPAPLGISTSRRDSGLIPTTTNVSSSPSPRRKDITSASASGLPPLPTRPLGGLGCSPQTNGINRVEVGNQNSLTSSQQQDKSPVVTPSTSIAAEMMGKFNTAVSTLTAKRKAVEDLHTQRVDATTSHLDRIQAVAPELIVSQHLHDLVRSRTREALMSQDYPSDSSSLDVLNPHRPPVVRMEQGGGSTASSSLRQISTSSPKRRQYRSTSPNDPLAATVILRSQPSLVRFDLDPSATVEKPGNPLVPPRRFVNQSTSESGPFGGAEEGNSPTNRRKGKRVSMLEDEPDDYDTTSSSVTKVVVPHHSHRGEVRVAGKELIRLRTTFKDWTSLSTANMAMVFELVRGTRVLQRAIRVYRARRMVRSRKVAVERRIAETAQQEDAQLKIACAWRQFASRLRLGNVGLRAHYLIEQRVELERQGSYAAGLILQDNNIRPRPHGPLAPAPPDFFASGSSMGSMRFPRRHPRGGGNVTRVESFFPGDNSSSVLGATPASSRWQKGGGGAGGLLFPSTSCQRSPTTSNQLVFPTARFEMPFGVKDPRYGALHRIQMKISQRLIARAWRGFREYEAVEAQLEAEVYLDHLLKRTPFPLVLGTRSALVGEGAAGLVTHTLQEAMDKRERRLARVARDANRLHLTHPNRRGGGAGVSGRGGNQDSTMIDGAPLSFDRPLHPPGSTISGGDDRRVSRRHSSLRAMSSSGASALGLYTVGSDLGSEDYDVPSDADSVDMEIAKLEHMGYETTYVYRAIPGSDEWVLVPVAVPTSVALTRPQGGSDQGVPASRLRSLLGSSASPTTSSLAPHLPSHFGGGGPTPPRRFSSRAILSTDSRYGSPVSGSSPRGAETDMGQMSSESPHTLNSNEDGAALAAHGRLIVKAPRLKPLVKVNVRALREQAEEDRRREEAFRLAELQRHKELERETVREQERRAQQAIVLQKAGRGYLRRIDLVAVFIAKLSADLTYGHLLSELTTKDPNTAFSMGFSVSAAATLLQPRSSISFAKSNSSNIASDIGGGGDGQGSALSGEGSSPTTPGTLATSPSSGGFAHPWIMSLKRADGNSAHPSGGGGGRGGYPQPGGFMSTLKANPHLQVATLVRMGHQQDAALPTRACLEVTRDIFDRNPTLFPEAALLAKKKRDDATLIIQACARYKIQQYFTQAMRRYEAAKHIQGVWRLVQPQ